MLRFNVSGEYIDLYEDTTLTFKKKNILFAFENIECERSASFSIPATQQNDKIFGLSRWLNTTGAGMRRRYEAQMQASMVTKDGYLYVDAYADGKYKAIFVTGELLGLLRIKDAGKIADIIQTSETTTWNSFPYTPTNGKKYALGVRALRYGRRAQPVPVRTPPAHFGFSYAKPGRKLDASRRASLCAIYTRRT